MTGRLKNGGVFISNLPSAGTMLAAQLAPLLRRLGFTRTQAVAWVKPSGTDLAAISQMIEDGRLRTMIDKVYLLDEIRAAHRHSESGRARGKIVVTIPPNASATSG